MIPAEVPMPAYAPLDSFLLFELASALGFGLGLGIKVGCGVAVGVRLGIV